MSDSQELDDRLYELLILGIHLRAEGGAGAMTTAYPVIGALTQVACYRELVHRKWTNRTGLISRVQLHAKEARREEYAVATRLEVAGELAQVTDEHLIILVSPQRSRQARTGFDHSRVLGTGGYSLLLTAKGREEVTRLTERYPLLTLQQYMAGQARFGSLRSHEKRNI